jgi:hypothetical protein
VKCQRCLSGKEARYRAYTDVMEMNVCRPCAAEARQLGISLAWIVRDKIQIRSLEPSGEIGSRSGQSAVSKRYPIAQ